MPSESAKHSPAICTRWPNSWLPVASPGGDGVHWCVLDSGVRRAGGARHPAVSGESAQHEERAGKTYRLPRMPVDPHSVGLLHSAFRPKGDVCAVRSLIRHRNDLVEIAVVLGKSLSTLVDHAELSHPARIAGLGCLAIPDCCLDIVLRHSHSTQVQITQIRHGLAVAGFGGFALPVHRLCHILRRSQPVHVSGAQVA
jgi:hypothetical protein